MAPNGPEKLRIIGDQYVTVLRVIGEYKNADGKLINYETLSELHAPGEVIETKGLHPSIVEKYNAGDEHTLSLFEEVEAEEEKPKAKTPKAVKEVPDKDKQSAEA